jgi:hypothetical protein
MKSNRIAKGGIFTALSLILLYLSSILPTNKLFMLIIASCIIPLSIMITGIKNTIVVYSAVSLLSFFIIPSKIISAVYILIFGSYGFVKYFIEKLRNVPLEIILKLLYFNIASVIILAIYKLLFFKIPNININIYLVILAIEIAFVIYDYALTSFISYANKNLLKKLK